MPVQRCERDGEQGWKWGEQGKCYIPSEEGSDEHAKRKAYLQGVAIGEISESAFPHFKGATMEHSELASILEVPVLTTGIFQGHKGPPVVTDELKLDRIIEASNRMRGAVKSAQMTGIFPGNPGLAERLGKPIPAFINLNHQSLQEDRVREWLKTVDVEFEKRLIFDAETGEEKPWIVQSFRNVPAEMADIIRRYFPKRSIELVPMVDPTTGEEYTDGVIISTAFLDRATRPAVPGQGDDLVVEFAASDNTAVVITTEEPYIMEAHTMPNDKQDEQARVSELQKEKDTLAAELAKEREEKEKAIELARKANEAKDAELKAVQQQIAELKAAQECAEGEKLLDELSAPRTIEGIPYQLSKSALDTIAPHIQSNGIAELSEGEQPRHGIKKLVETLSELAANDALLVQLGTVDKPSYRKTDDVEKSDTEKAAELMQKNPGMTENEAFVELINQRFGKEGA